MAQSKAQQSTNKKTAAIIERYLRIHQSMKLFHAQKLCQEQLGMKLRYDYLVCSLMGKNYFIDCDNYMIYKGE